MYFCCSWFLNMVSLRYVLVFLNFLHDTYFIEFYTISFLGKHIFFNDEKRKQWNLNTKVKVFHESISCFMKWPWNCTSWNAMKNDFTVYSSLNKSFCRFHHLMEAATEGALQKRCCAGPFVEQFLILSDKTILNQEQLIKRSRDIRH